MQHGGGILHDGDTYYWFGEHKTEGTAGNNALGGSSLLLFQRFI